ncbi:2'-5' RNA ligase family protein [Dyadobacter chenwenxiniae]|uniref:2'-5' RNA ligase family protein n=1 Tax=Dyadobacter chenwenxiniae TaxID=2906456 RepID=A0A9X1PQ14_9BACT|nr:2'-5' RNA ligase family protein [Dyadobacter chenwenxiniae]MCF0065310.1 2'-5' RNA ligase family protein [Dyadobacter chenwenxiniae]UON84422.1 2'-5' RNA ligase family protein [Dyadobacter chenwenxiniae]
MKPLVATFAITPSLQSYFNELRKQHFPAERNYIDAHLTLFHALPDQPRIMADLETLANEQPAFDVTAESVISLGNGTAFKIASPDLPALHQKLQKGWFEFLTNQDRQKRNFHVTIQNKVEPQVAKKLQAELASDFKPFTFAIQGIQLWRYHNGPWEFLMQFDFHDRV